MKQGEAALLRSVVSVSCTLPAVMMRSLVHDWAAAAAQWLVSS